MNAPQSWAILGGGFLGMTLALRLAQQGRSVTLIESAPFLGGVAAPWQLGDVVWDRHYHVILMSDTRLRGLLSELGLDTQINWVQTRTGFYTDSKLYSLSNTLEFLTFPPLNLIDKVRLGTTVLYASRITDWKKLEAIPVTTWLARWSGERTLDKIWLPLLRSKLGDNYKKASAAFIWAVIARMYAARRAGMKREMFGYVPGGYARIIDAYKALLAANNVTVQLGTAVESVTADASGHVAVRVSGTRKQLFGNVALTMAAPMASQLCPDLSPKEKQLLNGIEYQGIICASLLLKKPLADYYVTNITDPWVPYTGVIEMSALVDRKCFNGYSLVYLPKYIPAESHDFALADDAVRELFLSGLERMYPQFDRSHVVCFKLSRVKYLLPISTLNYSDRLPAIFTSVPGIHIVNSAHIVNGTLNVNETVQLAERTAASFLELPADIGRSRGEYDKTPSQSVA